MTGGSEPAWFAELDDLVRQVAPGAVAMLDLERRRAASARPRIAVTGAFNVGKSSLANALVGSPVFEVSAVRASMRPVVAAVEEVGDATVGWVRLDESVPFDVVDAPPIDGLGGRLAQRGVVGACHGVLFVIDASQAPTRAELDELVWLRTTGLTPVVVVTKIDMYPDWREVVAETERSAGADGGRVDVIPVSAALAEAGLVADGRIEELSAVVRERFVDRFERDRDRHRRAGAHRVLDAVVAAVGGAGPVVDDDWLRTEPQRCRRLVRETFAELASDLDDGLAASLRDVRRIAEETIDEVDPAAAWPELELWVRHALEQAALGLLDDLLGRVDAAVVEVSATLVNVGGPAIVRDHGVDLALDPDARVRVDLGATRRGVSVAALRSSYGGVLMAGMAGTAMGLALLNPISLVVGAGLGAKVITDDRTRQVDDRRRAARQAIARFLDDQRPVVRAELRSTIRSVDRAVSALVDEGLDAMAALGSGAVADAPDLAARVSALRERVDAS